MIKKVILAMSFATAVVNAQFITQNFGSGANSFSIDFVEIGNPGNVADTSGWPNPVGSVAYNYNIGKYEISRDMIEKANYAGSLGITMADMTSYGGNGVNMPATGINWYEAAKFVNYLNISAGSSIAYKFDASGNFKLWSSGDVGYNTNNQFRNSLARYVIASDNEWYKAAYGSPSGIWYDFTTGSDSRPTAVVGGTSPNTAVYSGLLFGQLSPYYPSEVDNAGGLSAYGTMAQGGNVWELTETAYDGINDTTDENRIFRGGSWMYEGTGYLNAIAPSPVGDPANDRNFMVGFRVAMVPEPSALSLLAVGLGGLAMMRRRRS